MVSKTLLPLFALVRARARRGTLTLSSAGRSSDFDVNDSLLGNAGPPPPPVCQQCRVEPAKARCVQCAQFQCDRCCVSLHKQEGRRHHQVRCFCFRVLLLSHLFWSQLKHLKSLYSAEAQEVIALCHQPAASLGHSVGLARQVLGKLKDIVGAFSFAVFIVSCCWHVLLLSDESPLGTISMLREMESSIECEDMARDAEERASGMIHSSASSVVSKHGSLEIPGGSGSQSTVGPVGRRRLRSSVTELTFQKKNQGLEKFPAKSAARRKSDVMVAKEIALQRAKEKVRMLYQSAPELELAQFYISHGKLPDAEATVLSFVEELKGKVPEDDPLWFRSYGVILRLRCEQKMWGAAVAAGTSALSLVTVC